MHKRYRSESGFGVFIIIVLLAVVLLVGVAYVALRHHQQETKLKQAASDAQAITQAAASQRIENATNLNFDTYQPSYLPQDYKLISDSTYGPALNSPDSDGSPENFELTYFGNDSTDEIFIDSYATPINYNPPNNCGIDARGYYGKDDVNSCKLIGHSTAGCDVYYSSGDGQAYCRLGDTVVGSYFYASLVPDGSTTSDAEHNQILKIYNSLQKLTTQQIQRLIDQTKSSD